MSARLSYLQLVRQNRVFGRLWLGETIGFFGNWFHIIALTLILVDSPGTPAEGAIRVALLLAVETLPGVLLVPIFGFLIDFWDRRKILVYVNWIRTGLALIFIPLVWIDSVFLYLLFAAFLAMTNQLFNSCVNSCVAMVCERRELVTGNSMVQLSWGLMLCIGAGAGGLAKEHFGDEFAFAVNAATFLVGGILIATISPKRFYARATVSRARTKLRGSRPFRKYIEGLRYISSRPAVLIWTLTKPLWAIGGGTLFVLYPVLADQVYKDELLFGLLALAPAVALSALYFARGLGVLTGAAFTNRVVTPKFRIAPWVLAFMLIVFGAAYIIVGLGVSLTVAVILIAMGAFASSQVWALTRVGIQRTAEEAWMGRVMSTDEGLFTLALVLGALASAFLFNFFDPLTVTWITGIYVLSVGVLALIGLLVASSRWRDRLVSDVDLAPSLRADDAQTPVTPGEAEQRVDG